MPFRRLGEPFKTLGRAAGSGVGGASATNFILNDEYRGAEAAPLASPRNADPGPGTETIIDTGPILDVIGGEVVPSGAITGAGDPAIFGEIQNQQAGMAAYFRLRNYTAFGLASNNIACGWSDDATPVIADMAGLYLGNGGQKRYANRGVATNTLGTYPNDELFDCTVILRDMGFWSVVENKLDWVDPTLSVAQMYPAISCLIAGRAPFGLDKFRVSQLNAPWNQQYGIATDILLGARADGDTFDLLADFLLEFAVGTLPPGGLLMEVRFRIVDDQNHWRVTIDSAGDIDLDEVVAGVVTQRGTFSGVANGHRIVVIADESDMAVFVNNVNRITYGAAANFIDDTGGELESEGGGSVLNIVSWPRNITGEAKEVLDRLAA